jgi:hypothetical protein
MTRFWLTLDRLPGPAAVAREWQWWLRDELAAAHPYLVPDPTPATAYPHPKGGLPLAVVPHGPDEFAAVDDGGGVRLQLRRSDLVVYRVDFRKLLRAAAGALGIEPDGDPVGDLRNTFRMGDLTPAAGRSFPVYFTAQTGRDEFHTAAQALAIQTATPFVLTAPTNHFYRSQAQRLLADRDGTFVPLADALVPAGSGTLAITEAGRYQLDRFGAAVVPAAQPATESFPAPAGCTWADLQVRFRDGHSVSVEIGGKTAMFNYTQMGLHNLKNGKPDKQWELLREFADGGGFVGWSGARAPELRQKQRENLGHALADFFLLPGDPFRVNRPDRRWEAVFRIGWGR